MVRNKVLILSANYGDGHAQVSNALVAELQALGIENIKVVDLLGQSHPFIDSVSRQFYLKSYTTVPAIYGWLYHSTKHLPLESRRAKWLHSFGLNKMKQLLRDETPDLLVHTFPGSAASELKQKTDLDVPIFSVITDFTFHQRWAHKQMDRYFVSTEALKQEIIEAGEPEDKVVVSGIPIRSRFEKATSKSVLYKKHDLDPEKPVILIMAGAYGVSSDVKKTCEGLTEVEDVQVVVICGKSQSLKKEMEKRFGGFRHFKIMGYVDTLYEWIQVSTCMVSKPGGVTISEALANRLPLFFLPPVAGQEEENARFIEQQGAGRILNRRQDMARQILQTIQDEPCLLKMRDACDKTYKPNAAKVVAENIFAFLQNRYKQQRVNE